MVEKKEKSYSSFISIFSQSLSVPEGVDHKKAEIIKEGDGKANKVTIKFPKLKVTNS